MTKCKMCKKIHVDDLKESALKWFDDLFDADREDIMIKEYMKDQKIAESDVEW